MSLLVNVHNGGPTTARGLTGTVALPTDAICDGAFIDASIGTLKVVGSLVSFTLKDVPAGKDAAFLFSAHSNKRITLTFPVSFGATNPLDSASTVTTSLSAEVAYPAVSLVLTPTVDPNPVTVRTQTTFY